MVAMVDNFHALVTKLEHAVPAEPLYFLKGNNSFLAANQVIRTPKSYSGKVVYEGELGIVIGKPCFEMSAQEAAAAIVQPVRKPRERKPLPPQSDEPLIQVDTRR